MKNILIGGVLVLLVLGFLFFMNSNSAKTPSETQDLSDFPSETNTGSQPSSSPTSSAAAVPASDELVIEDIKTGTGVEVKSGDTVSVHYVGTLTDGQKFDSSRDRNQPFSTQIGVGNVIAGWDQGIVGMKVGGVRKLVIPSALGYGAQAAGSIPPNSTLVFEVELLEVK